MPNLNYMPGVESRLEKAQLQSLEGADQTPIAVYFNPKELTIDKPVPWQKHKHVEGDQPMLEFTAAEPKTLTCELMFDLFEDRGDVYTAYVKKIEKLALIDEKLKHPPRCMFWWGPLLFEGVVENLNVKYTLFLPDGTPCRATVGLKMKEAAAALNKQEQKEGGKKKEHRPAPKVGMNAHNGALTSRAANKNLEASEKDGKTTDSRGFTRNKEEPAPSERPAQDGGPPPAPARAPLGRL